MSSADELWNDATFILKRKFEQQDYMMEIATCTRRSKERKKELLDSASEIHERFVKRFCEVEGHDYELHLKIRAQILETMKKNGL